MPTATKSSPGDRSELANKIPMNGSGRRSTRRKARRVLLQVLYEVDTVGHSLEESLGWVTGQAHLDKNNSSFIRHLAEEVIAQRDDLDVEIQRYAQSWPVEQLSPVDRNILRIAIYEVKHGKGVPLQVAINEAVELAKRFGGESSPRFVNGVLGAVAESMS